MARVALPSIAAPAARLPLPRPSRGIVAAALVAIAILLPFGFWLRDSPLVAVKHVEVSGVSGSDAAAIRRAIAEAADGMSTLHIDRDRLHEAVRRFPVVADIDVRRDLPHTLRVAVRERVPVAALAFGSRREAVAADGTVLADTSAVGLPLVHVDGPPGGERLTEATSLKLVALLGAAPPALRARVSRVALGSNGLTAFLVRGPNLYFGPGTRLVAKWLAAARVLADPSSRGARYIELRVPEHPAAGGLVPIVQQTVTTNPQPEVESPVGP